MKNIIQAGKQQILAQINRDDFLRGTFVGKYQQTNNLPAPEKIGVSQEELYRKAREIIKNHSLATTLSSAALSVPGGFTMAATIPADLYQYCRQLLVVAQKLSYLYGMPDLEKCNDTVHFNLLCGMLMIMLGHKANMASKPIIRMAMQAVGKKVLASRANQDMASRAILFVLKNIGAKQFSRKGITQTVGKLIPIVSAAISGTITFATFYPACNRLHRCLEKEAYGCCSC